jgi:hypothetical protein
MRTLSVLFVVGCATSPAQPYHHPTAATGGFAAPASTEIREWVELGTPVATSPMQQTLVVSPTIGPLRQLMLKGVTGEARIAQILVTYTDQSERTFELRKLFGPGDGQVIELREPQQVAKVVVFTEPESTGSIVVLGA